MMFPDVTFLMRCIRYVGVYVCAVSHTHRHTKVSARPLADFSLAYDLLDVKVHTLFKGHSGERGQSRWGNGAVHISQIHDLGWPGREEECLN